MGERKRLGAQRLAARMEEYFAACQREQAHPSLPGLALAAGFATRRELEQAAGEEGPGAAVLRRAMTQVEEATVQSAFTKDFAASAKFILQNGFGYSEKAVSLPPDEIKVLVQPREGAEPCR